MGLEWPQTSRMKPSANGSRGFDSFKMSELFSNAGQLVRNYDIKGKPAHDARLVAAMLRHDVTDLVTFNAGDFARYDEINVHTPEDIVHAKFSIG
jgi:hypothetical protein